MNTTIGNKIFSDGKIVATFEIPEDIQKDIYKKKNWGVEMLTAHAQKFFGEEAKWLVEESTSQTRITGTKSVHVRGSSRTTFMLVETKEKPEVHVSKLVEDLTEGDMHDVFSYQIQEREKRGEGLNSPFVTLEAMDVSKLPKQQEIVELRVQRDRKHGGLKFAPQYKNEDPCADGQPSMRFFRPVKEMTMKEDQRYKARVIKATNTGRKNKKGLGVPIIDVKVEVLKSL